MLTFLSFLLVSCEFRFLILKLLLYLKRHVPIAAFSQQCIHVPSHDWYFLSIQISSFVHSRLYALRSVNWYSCRVPVPEVTMYTVFIIKSDCHLHSFIAQEDRRKEPQILSEIGSFLSWCLARSSFPLYWTVFIGIDDRVLYHFVDHSSPSDFTACTSCTMSIGLDLTEMSWTSTCNSDHYDTVHFYSAPGTEGT